MIYRDERARIHGIWNKTTKWTAERHVVIFEERGLSALTEWLRDNGAKWGASSSQNNSNPARQKWDLNAGYEGALKLARDGWAEGMDAMEQALQAIIPAVGHDARWGWSVTGGSPSVSRFLRGHPKNMRNRRKKAMGSAPVLHIAVNCAASCAVSATQMANYGAAIVGLIDRLETTGKRVHLDVVNVTCVNGGVRLAHGWNVKLASEHVDLGAVAFSLAHPASFRRLGFAMMERSPADCETYGYGYAADLHIADVPEATEGTMLVDGVNHAPDRCNDVTDALRLAIEQVNKAAVIAGHSTPDCPLIDEEQAMEMLYA
jgi:hypothetical protein